MSESLLISSVCLALEIGLLILSNDPAVKIVVFLRSSGSSAPLVLDLRWKYILSIEDSSGFL